jgi:ATP:cob(I)alamin adenosyltransferase
MNTRIKEGTTYLSNGTKVSKNNIIVKFFGELDELSAEIGYINTLVYKYFIKDNQYPNLITKYYEILYEIQKDINAIEENVLFKDSYKELSTKKIKDYLVEINKILPIQHNFVLSGGNITIASIFKARAKCRAAERRLVSMNYYYFNSETLTHSDVECIQKCLEFINILSDYFYMLARYTYNISEIDEIII